MKKARETKAAKDLILDFTARGTEVCSIVT
jgi:hypothetical protein